MFNITPLVRTLIIINVAVFLLQSLLANLHVTEFMSLWDIHSDLFRPYQFFTYMFAHGSFTHIFFNMIAFASFAPILEGYWGDKKFLTFYIATGMGAGVIYAAFNFFFSRQWRLYARGIRRYIWHTDGFRDVVPQYGVNVIVSPYPY